MDLALIFLWPELKLIKSRSPHADATVAFNLSLVLFATSTHRVVTQSLLLRLHLWQQSPPTPPKTLAVIHLRITLGGVRPKTRILSSPLSHRELCVCVCVCVSVHIRGWIMIWVTLWWLIFLFPVLARPPLPLRFHRWPTWRMADDVRADDRIARRHLQSTTLKEMTQMKNKRDDPWHTSTPPQHHSQRTPTTPVPLWSFTSSFLLQNMEKKTKKN